MTKKISETRPVKDFVNIAGRFCFLIENRDQKTDIKVLQEAFIILPELCVSAARLPEIRRFSHYKLSGIPHEHSWKLYQSLLKKLAGHDIYTEVFDPWDSKDKQAIPMTLSDDLTDIYSDLKPGLQEWEQVTSAQKLDIIWKWKFLFGHHWGWHATEAFRALFWLLYQHVKDENGDYVGIRSY